MGKPAQRRPAKIVRAEKKDEYIMDVCIKHDLVGVTNVNLFQTNNSSIVSKRSVERLYYPNEPHFFQHFVRKSPRRAPLVNRGYWLRMKAVDHVVQQFLEESSTKTKVVINLGAG
jgi:tRNA wybutosine-synthesizing protein 4